MSETFRDLEETLDRNWEELMKLPHALNAGISTKFVGGIDTRLPCIALFVDRKVPKDPEEAKKLGLEPLKPEHVVPQKIEGMPVDVVELSTKDYELGETSVSRLPPDIQRRLMGAKRKPQQVTKAVGVFTATPLPATGPDLSSWASPIQDQKSCGSCTGEGTNGVMESVIRIAANDMKAVNLLSVRDLFIRSGGTCEGGNTPDAVLNQAMNGVALEVDCPYDGMANGSDTPCVLPVDWWTRGKRIKGWNPISNLSQIKFALLSVPLCVTMEVHQSFLNYKGGGPYHNLGPMDPVVGGHMMGVFQYDDTLGGGVFRNLRNSWGTSDWGKPEKPGWADVLYGELDAMQYQLTPDGPIPEPSPEPTPCRASMWIVKRPRGKWFLRNYRRVRKALFGIKPGIHPEA